MFGCSLENGSGLRICGSLRLFANVMRRTPTVDWKAALQRKIRMQVMKGWDHHLRSSSENSAHALEALVA